ncbi:MAG: hypothetical protein J5994_08825 [Ruminococcus sp.]|nr:hypothetical protein [Ruminococcus sp.]
MAFTLIIVIFALLIIAGYQIRENAETKRRIAAEEEKEQTRQELAEVEDKLSRSYGRVTYRTRGIMPEIHKN